MKILILFAYFTFCSLLYSQPFTWKTPVNLSNVTAEGAAFPTMAIAENGDIYIAWSYPSSGGGDRDIYMTWFDGQNWHTPEKIYDDTTAVYTPKLVIDSTGTLHLTITQQWGGSTRIIYKKRENGIWSLPIQLSPDSLGTAHKNEMVVDRENNLHVFWDSDKIYHNCYNDSTWAPLVVLQHSPNLVAPFNPKAAIDSENNIHLIFLAFEPTQIDASLYHQIFNGNTWSVPVKVNDTLFARYPDIEIDENDIVHVAWSQRMELFGYKMDIFYKFYQNQYWSSPINISNFNVHVYWPLIQIYRENPIIFFGATSNNYVGPMYYAFPDSSGWQLNNWEITSKPGMSYDYKIVNDSIIHMVYLEHTTTNTYDIYYTTNSTINNLIPPTKNYPKQHYLSYPFPNPTNSEVNIKITVLNRVYADINIYDINGKEVKQILKNQYFQPGEHRINWDGKNNLGKEVSSGIYYFVFKNGDIFETRKALLIK